MSGQDYILFFLCHRRVRDSTMDVLCMHVGMDVMMGDATQLITYTDSHSNGCGGARASWCSIITFNVDLRYRALPLDNRTFSTFNTGCTLCSETVYGHGDLSVLGKTPGTANCEEQGAQRFAFRQNLKAAKKKKKTRR